MERNQCLDAKHASIVLELMNKQRKADSSKNELCVGCQELSTLGQRLHSFNPEKRRDPSFPE